MLRKAAILFVGVVLCAGSLAYAQEAPVRYDGHKLVEVTLQTPADVETMLAISSDHWSESVGVGVFPFRVPPDQMPKLEASGLKFQVLQQDIQTLIDREQAELAVQKRAWFDDYKTRDQINAYIDTLVAARPDLCSKLTVGNSLENRTIYALRISSSLGGSSKPALLFNGCQHAREWISPMTVMYIADQLVAGYDTDPHIANLLDSAVFYIVPVVNPDGYVYTWSTQRLWRKNRRNNGDGTYGVDLNRNWSVGWGLSSGSSGSTSSETYRGTAAFSEPETQVLRDFINAHTDIVAHIDFHSYSQLILEPWGYQSSYAPEPDRTVFANLGADMAQAIYDVHGEVYTDQASFELYLSSGVMSDWTYGAKGALGFGIELRDTGLNGFVLPADQIIPTGQENFEAIKVLADYVTTLISLTFPDGVPTEVDADTATTFRVQITEVNDTYLAGSGKLLHRVGNSGAFSETPLTSLGGGIYQATLPATACGADLEFYVEAQTTGGSTIRSPDNAPSTVYNAVVVQVIVEDSLETNTGWTAGFAGDTATTGIWTRVNPNGTAAQPEDDHTPAAGVTCWVTGQGTVGGGVGDADVDGGRTTLLTPIYDLSAAVDPYISYWRWFSNNQGSNPSSDTFLVEVSNGGAWVSVETVGPTGAEAGGGWVAHQFRVADILTPNATVQVRFIAQDTGGGSIVEAAIDDLRVWDADCPATCPADLDGNGTVGPQDLALLLASWQSGAGGDVDGDNDTDAQDLALLLSAWETNCP